MECIACLQVGRRKFGLVVDSSSCNMVDSKPIMVWRPSYNTSLSILLTGRVKPMSNCQVVHQHSIYIVQSANYAILVKCV